MNLSAIHGPAGHAAVAQRLRFLDGLRGVAILFVVAYHYLSRFAHDMPGLYPYGSIFADVWIFKYGYYGVHLFFAISGFVIALSLERSQSFWEFAVKRFARLWPTMLLCAVITFTVLSVFPMYWPQKWGNFVPSLTFVDAVVWNRLFPALQSDWIDGAYWSLFVEIRFYFWSGLLYFICKKRFLLSLAVLSLLAVVLYAVLFANSKTYLADFLYVIAIAKYWPWFLVGIAAQSYLRGQVRVAWALVLLATLQLSLLVFSELPKYDVLVFVLVVFLLIGSQRIPLLRRLLESRSLVAVGVASYSLYLLHQNAGLTLISVFSRKLGIEGWASLLVMLLVLGLFLLFSRWIYRYWESVWSRVLVARLLNDEKHRLARHTAGISSSHAEQVGAR